MELGLFFFFPVLGEAEAEDESLGGLVMDSQTWNGRGLAARWIGSSEYDQEGGGGMEGGRGREGS